MTEKAAIAEYLSKTDGGKKPMTKAEAMKKTTAEKVRDFKANR
jgi:hypothetical protein